MVDVYDALTMQRAYKSALTPRKALDVMEDEVQRGWWDPHVFSVFRTMVEEDLPVQQDAQTSTQEV